MVADLISSLGIEARPLFIEGRIGGKLFLESWMWALVNDETTDIVSRSRLHLEPLGLGDGQSLSNVRMTLNSEALPIRVILEADGKTTIVDCTHEEFVEITSPDGSHNRVPGPRPAAILENNHPGHIAILLAVLRAQPDDAQNGPVSVLLPSASAIVDYAITPEGEGWVRSPFGERMRVAADGHLLQFVTEDGMIDLAPVQKQPPVPEMVSQVGPVYAPHADATFRIDDLELDGVHGLLHASLLSPAEPSGLGVLVLQGSGDVDRNGISGRIDTGTHAFGDALAQAGATVLRYDKRGTGLSRLGDRASEAGYEDAVEDANRCLHTLQAVEGVTPDRCIILGHSLGGVTALVVSVERNGGTLPLALLACPGRTLPELMRAQIRDLGRQQGVPEQTLDLQVHKLNAFLDHAEGDDQTSKDPVLQSTRAYRRQFGELVGRDPAEIIAHQRAPVLICQGGSDVQVSPEADTNVLFASANAARVPVDRVIIPELNHLFRTAGPDEGLSRYAEARPVDPRAIAAVVNWAEYLMR